MLVTDGVESCDGDLAATADELGRTSLDFTAHVITFDLVDAGEQAELEYLAAQTGGLFVSADSTEELKSALQSMMGDPEGETAEEEVEAPASEWPQNGQGA